MRHPASPRHPKGWAGSRHRAAQSGQAFPPHRAREPLGSTLNFPASETRRQSAVSLVRPSVSGLIPRAHLQPIPLRQAVHAARRHGHRSQSASAHC